MTRIPVTDSLNDPDSLTRFLDPAQQRTLLDWVGEPYRESWKVLKGKQ